MNFATLPIPSPDLLPLPAPAWLLVGLSVFTLLLHLLAMNLTLGASLVAVWATWRRNESLARLVLNTLPVSTAMTITSGVAPLLFVQLLYGQFFYAASILMAVPWMLVVLLLMLAYYGFYFNYFKSAPLTACNVAVALGSAFAVLAIGFIYVNNFTLMLTPERWPTLINGASTRGTALNTGEPTLLPRYLHVVTAALAVTGLYLALRGQLRCGAFLFGGATLINIGFGLWFLFALPESIRNLFLGGNAAQTGHLWGGVGLAIAALMLMMLAVNATRPKPLLIAAALVLVLVVDLMATVRHFVREAYLTPHFDVWTAPVRPMWDVFALFAVTLVVGLGVVAWMITKVIRARA